jgi:hypothetical protein
MPFKVGFDPMLAVTVKALLVAFTMVVGGCFAMWPAEVLRRFDIWNGRTVSADEEARLNPRRDAVPMRYAEWACFLL